MADLMSDISPRVAEAMTQDASILDNFGMRVVSAQDGACEISCVVSERLVNAAGFAHGSIAFALMDTACAYALGSLEIQAVTLNGNTTYVRGAQANSILRARVSVVSRTRRIASLRAEVSVETDHGPEVAAHGSFVFQLIEVRS
ncbi:MAG: PaaI family thioesterase [Cyanophyceae cyanobacterium]